MLLFLCSGVLVCSLGVYVSWYLCVLCVGGLVFVSGLRVLFPVLCGVLLGLCSVSTSVLVGAVSIFGACPCVVGVVL